MQRGLRLANSYLGTVLIAWFYALWALIGLILCLVFITMAIMGKSNAFEKGLNPIALYSFGAPMVTYGGSNMGCKAFLKAALVCHPRASDGSVPHPCFSDGQA